VPKILTFGEVPTLSELLKIVKTSDVACMNLVVSRSGPNSFDLVGNLKINFGNVFYLDNMTRPLYILEDHSRLRYPIHHRSKSIYLSFYS